MGIKNLKNYKEVEAFEKEANVRYRIENKILELMVTGLSHFVIKDVDSMDGVAESIIRFFEKKCKINLDTHM